MVLFLPSDDAFENTSFSSHFSSFAYYVGCEMDDSGYLPGRLHDGQTQFLDGLTGFINALNLTTCTGSDSNTRPMR